MFNLDISPQLYNRQTTCLFQSALNVTVATPDWMNAPLAGLTLVFASYFSVWKNTAAGHTL